MDSLLTCLEDSCVKHRRIFAFHEDDRGVVQGAGGGGDG